MKITQINSLDLHITDRCNLKCKYCYLHQESYCPIDDISDDLINLLPQIVDKLKVKKVNFFGGEPLLAFNKIKKVVEVLKNRPIQFGISTNGTIGTPEIAEFLKKHNIGIQRSIDGCPEACALNRPNITDKYLELTKLYGDYGKPRRSTIAENAVGYVYKSWLWLKKNGFHKGWTPIPDNYTEWKDESIKTFVEQHKLIAKDLVNDVLSGKPPFYNFWFQRLMPCILEPNKDSSKGCGAGVTLLALRQDGNFFACHRFISEDVLSDWCFGNVHDVLEGKPLQPGPSASEAIELCKKKFTSEAFKECLNCPVKSGCPAGCYHTNLAINGKAYIPTKTFCKIRQQMLPVVQWIHEKLKDVCPNWYNPAKAIQGKKVYDKGKCGSC